MIKVVSQKHRDQTRNIDDCMEKLDLMLKEVLRPPRRRIDTKPTKSSVRKRVDNKKNKSKIKNNRKKVDY